MSLYVLDRIFKGELVSYEISGAEMAAIFQNETIILTCNLAASRFGGRTSHPLVKRVPELYSTPAVHIVNMFSKRTAR